LSTEEEKVSSLKASVENLENENWKLQKQMKIDSSSKAKFNFKTIIILQGCP